MITVKFFGMMSVNNNLKSFEVKEGTVKEVLKAVMIQYPDITAKQLKQSVMIINKKHVFGRKRLSSVLHSGDELVFLTPSSGG